ncbi:MAG: cytochrome c family protein [Rhizobiaceae bacterium]|nr:cytochrome c family protein [Rhizobiaceae bacterium]MCV0405708.1 cytochrome c family protein [Rhizobiaceae bacterium]
MEQSKLRTGHSLLIAFLVLLPAGRAAAQDIDSGKKLFARCAACHNAETTANKVGPHLNGVIGRAAAAVEGFNYSPAMKQAAAGGLVWDDAALHEYLANPKAKVPGTKMVFPGLKKEKEIDDLLAYLASVSG